MDWSKFLQLPGPAALAAFLAASGISWGYQQNIGLLRKLPPQFIVYANVGMFVFGAITLVWVAAFIWRLFAFFVGLALEDWQMRKLLDTLSPEEEGLLYQMRLANQQSGAFSVLDPVPTGLRHKKLLVTAGGVGNAMAFPHTIPSNVWKELGRRLAKSRVA